MKIRYGEKLLFFNISKQAKRQLYYWDFTCGKQKYIRCGSLFLSRAPC